MCLLFTWFNMQILNFCWWKHTKSEQFQKSCAIATIIMFIRNKKPEKNSTQPFRNSLTKFLKKNQQDFTMSSLGWRSFTKVFLLKLVIWIFFKYCKVLFLKTKHNLYKKDARHLNIAGHSKRRKKKWKKKIEKQKLKKEEKSDTSNKEYFTFTF